MSDRINPWAEPTAPEDKDDHGMWEQIVIGNDPDVWRLPVPGGWLYSINRKDHLAFVPGAW